MPGLVFHDVNDRQRRRLGARRLHENFQRGSRVRTDIRTVYLSPKWHGKEGEWAAVLAEVTQKQGTEEADAMLQMTFATVVMDDHNYEDIVPEIQKYWPQIKRGFHAREKLYKAAWGNMN